MKLKCYLIIILLSILFPMKVYSYNDSETHRYLTEASIIKSNFVDYLKKILGITITFDSEKNDNIIIQIQDGATNEDLGNRGYNHFYNPLLASMLAGLDDYPFPLFRIFGGKGSSCGDLYSTVGIPALGWVTGDSSRPCGVGNSDDDNLNAYSWKDARQTYYESFYYPERRDYYLSLFFEQFGRVLHMLEDMSVPAHVRNDMVGHLTPKGWEYMKGNWKKEDWKIWKSYRKYGGNNYENYVEINKKQGDISTYIGSKYAVVPKFAKTEQYWDKDRYNGTNPEITVSEQVGLSEYTNANFVSIETLFSNNSPDNENKRFPYPRASSMDREYPVFISQIEAEDGKYDNIPLLNKVRNGEIINKGFIGVKYLAYPIKSEAINSERLYFFNDPVYENHADILIPKTIAYTAGLINYFFRGRMGIVPKFSEYDVNGKAFRKITVDATNSSYWIDDQIEPMPDGTIDLVIRYKASPDDTEYSYTKAEYNNGEKGNYFQESNKASFEFYIDNSPIPTTASDLRVFLVYHGKLGEEENSVAVGSAEVNFKGSVDIDGRLGEADGLNINGITVFAKNTTGGETGTEVMSGGSVEAVIRYRYNPGAYFNMISIESQTDTIPRDSTSIHFDLSNNPLPVTATDISISLIYNGKVGETENAVCISSPDEITSDLGISVPEEGVYGWTTEKPQDPSHDGFSKISLVAFNRSNNEMSGDIQLAVSYRISQGEPVTSSGTYPDTSYETYEHLYNESSTVKVRSIPANGSSHLEFALGGNPIPVWATDVYFWIIIKTSSGTTHIGFKDVYEPTPIVVSNLGDWTFLNDTAYEVDTFYGLTLALGIVNYDQTGEVYYLSYDPPYEDASVTAWIVRDAFFRLSSINGDPLLVDEEAGGYSFNFPRIAPGHYKKAYVLGDESFYFAENRIAWHYPMISIYPDYTNGAGNKLFLCELACDDNTCSELIYVNPDDTYEYLLSSIKNQIDCPDEAICNYYNMPYPCSVRSVPAATRFRELDVYHMVGYSHDNPKGPYHDYSVLSDPLVEQLQ